MGRSLIFYFALSLALPWLCPMVASAAAPTLAGPAAPAAASAAAPAAADLAPEPRLVRVVLGPRLPLSALLEAGLDVVEVHAGREAMLLEWPGEDEKLASLGAAAELMDVAPGRSAARRTREELSARPALPGKRI